MTMTPIEKSYYLGCWAILIAIAAIAALLLWIL